MGMAQLGTYGSGDGLHRYILGGVH
jgi:hypothetical protein